MRQFASLAFCSAVVLGSAGTAHASSIAFDLDCVLGHPTPGAVACGGSVPTYGTVTFDDSPGNGDILLTVDLAGTGEKFKDLFFNYNGSAVKITAGAGTADLLDLNGQDTSPYSGLFDVGPLGATGDPFSVILYGWNNESSYSGNAATGGASNVALALSNFQVKDSLGKTYLSLHIQSIGPNGCEADGPLCVPGTTGNGSMNSVGANDFYDPNEVQITAEAPEPASLLLLGTGLIGAAMRGRRRKQ